MITVQRIRVNSKSNNSNNKSYLGSHGIYKCFRWACVFVCVFFFIASLLLSPSSLICLLLLLSFVFVFGGGALCVCRIFC